MQDFKRLNNIIGWTLFAISTTVFMLTVERTASYWDCGEFIAASYKLMVPHPPGAPLFLLIGRMFSFFALGDTTQVAFWINMISVLSSSFTILFLFWSITLLGRKLLKNSDSLDLSQKILLLGSGLVGALAYTFSDSFWFSAAEAEVYAMSSFFMAFVFWAILKWELIEDEALANRWMILIAYMVGLSIGVHLLNLVTLPALGLIYYFKKKESPSIKGIVTTLAVTGIIIVAIMVGIIPGIPSVAGSFELTFVNTFGLPFGSGIIAFGLIFLSTLVYGIYYSNIREKVALNTALLCFTMILIGYSSYSLVLIRSNYDPPIDENDPENIMSFVSYLKREQYGNRPLFYGQYFNAERIDQKQGDPIYVKGEEKYEIVDYKIDYVWDPKLSTIFPRAYSADPNHVKNYREIMGLNPGENPIFSDNLQYMFVHQMGHMYWRYFMWNFAGRESDIQNAGWLTPWDAMDDVPYLIAENKGRNNYFMIPFILGIIGLLFHYQKDPKTFGVILMLFFLLGLGLILYLNSPPVEPRERDYIYVGSFYAFAIWIGFSVMAIAKALAKVIKDKKIAYSLSVVLCLIAPAIMATENWDDHDRDNRYFSVDSAKNFLESTSENSIFFTGGDNDTFPLWYVQEVEGFRTDVRVVVLSYFNTDWYIDQMTRQAYKSSPFPFSLTSKEYYQGGPNDYLPFVENNRVDDGINLKQYLQLIKQGHPALRIPTTSNSYYNTVPSRYLILDVDKEAVLRKGIIPKGLESQVVDRMVIEVKGSGLEKKDLMILDIIVNGNWDRPIYFNNTSKNGININLNRYLIQEGNAYRLLPIENPTPGNDFVNTDIMYNNLLNNFHFRGLTDKNAYFNEDYRNFVLNQRSSFNTLAEALLNEGKIEKAREVLFKSIEIMPDEAIPYDYSATKLVDALFNVKEEDKAVEIAKIIGDRADEILAYYIEKGIQLGIETQKNFIILQELSRTLSRFGKNDLAKKYNDLLQEHAGKLQVYNTGNR